MNWIKSLFASILSPLNRSKSSDTTSNRSASMPEKLRSYLDQLDCDTYEIYVSKKNHFEKIRDILKEKEKGIKALLGDDKSDDLRSQRRELSNNKSQKEVHLSKYSQAKISDLNDLEQKLTQLEKDKQRINNDRVRNETRLEINTPISKSEIEQLQQELEGAKTREKYFQNKFDTYSLTIDLLGETKTSMAGNIQTILGSQLSENFSVITDGRYDKVNVNKALEISLDDVRTNQTIYPENLSAGTHDQIYFATRLALIDALFKQINPPIILDDPFINFDEHRLVKALSLLETISKTHQVILFTCRRDVEQIKKANISLEML